ncbi:protein-glutamate methylesterase/protein-glutamine glutaminase [Vibrio sp. WXL210]|uniref:protein-glutamate methylesterase/protein-glutamine glutaminase n=1 Tax=Vibrio sp. WXL210 TaxID=3450709 RepID=UPI003EC6B22C
MSLKVLIIDSCHQSCDFLQQIVASQPSMSVVGIAHDAQQARHLIKQLNPDVVTLAIELSGMNGLDFLSKIMALRPMPVVIVSKLVNNNPVLVDQALKIGATACVQKPNPSQLRDNSLDTYSLEVIKQLRQARLRFDSPRATISTKPAVKPLKRANTEQLANRDFSPYLVAVGASTGGTEAITQLLTKLPKNCPGIVIAQHMPYRFTQSFAARLQSLCVIEVQEAKHDQVIKVGHAYIAPGDKHLVIHKRSGCYYTMLSDDEPVNLHKPSVDVLFDSVAENVKQLGLGIILTGMGKDGAKGLLRMKRAGAMTLAQDKDSCVVYGMPREAKKIGAVHKDMPISELVEAILELNIKPVVSTS